MRIFPIGNNYPLGVEVEVKGLGAEEAVAGERVFKKDVLGLWYETEEKRD